VQCVGCGEFPDNHRQGESGRKASAVVALYDRVHQVGRGEWSRFHIKPLFYFDATHETRIAHACTLRIYQSDCGRGRYFSQGI
jgi:hypothetical protein